MTIETESRARALLPEGYKNYALVIPQVNGAVDFYSLLKFKLGLEADFRSLGKQNIETKVVIDLSNITKISSSGFTTLLQLYKDHRGDLVLANVAQKITDDFDTAGFSELFTQIELVNPNQS